MLTDDPQLAEVALPGHLVVVHARVADDLVPFLGQHGHGQAVLDVLPPEHKILLRLLLS